MTRPLRIVAVSGGLQRPSRAAALAEHLLDLIGEDIHSEQQLIELGELAPQLAGALWRSQLPEAVERQLVAVEQADVLVVATPVYRGSYTGLFKHFFDFIDQDALVDTPILLAATGGSLRCTGDGGGMVNVPKLKGIHYAIRSGMLAAETLYRGLRSGSTDFSSYERAVHDSEIGKDLYESRNMKQPFGRGLIVGGAISLLTLPLALRRGR